MEFTSIGIVILVLSIALPFVSRLAPFFLFIVTAAFPATAFVNISGGGKFGIQVGYWAGAIWIIIVFLRGFSSFIIDKYGRLLVLFWLISGVSLVMPLIAGGDALVHNPKDMWELTRLDIEKAHITQYLYLTFVIIVPLTIRSAIKNMSDVEKSIRVLVLTAIIVAAIGFWQAFGEFINIDYPDWFFNNNVGYGLAFNQYALPGFSVLRMSSVAPEPSMLAGYFMWIIPILLTQITFKLSPAIVKGNAVWLLLIILSFILTLSTTALVGVIIIVIATIVTNSVFSERSSWPLMGYYVFLFLSIAATGYLIAIYVGVDPDFATTYLANNLLAEKIENESGQLRSSGFLLGLELFFDYPILGVGYGNNRTFDLFTNIISNTGLFGAIAFFSFFSKLLYSLAKLGVNNNALSRRERVVAATLFSSLACGIGGSFISNPDIIFLTMWIVSGLSMAFIALIQKKLREA